MEGTGSILRAGEKVWVAGPNGGERQTGKAWAGRAARSCHRRTVLCGGGAVGAELKAEGMGGGAATFA